MLIVVRNYAGMQPVAIELDEMKTVEELKWALNDIYTYATEDNYSILCDGYTMKDDTRKVAEYPVKRNEIILMPLKV